MATNEQLLTVDEVAARLRVSTHSVYRWLRSGKLAGVRLGGTKAGWRISEGDVQRFLAELRGESTGNE